MNRTKVSSQPSPKGAPRPKAESAASEHVRKEHSTTQLDMLKKWKHKFGTGKALQ